MKEQTFILQNYKDFEPRHIFECGQCFRWNLQSNGSYTGVFKNNVMNVSKEANCIIFKGMCEENIIKVINDYFDFDTNYSKIKEQLSKVDDYLKESIEFGSGIRILNQDLWETIISFIISANNNIPRIKGIIERICRKYGNKLEWNNETYYTFPTPKQLAKASVQDLRGLGLGFRDVRVFETTKMILNEEVNLQELIEDKDVDYVRKKLLTLPGVGPKVADCIMLFGLKRLEVFPIDVWVRRVMNELYFKNEDETKVNKKQIEKLAMEKYKDLAGLAQQYLFYWKRETA